MHVLPHGPHDASQTSDPKTCERPPRHTEALMITKSLDASWHELIPGIRISTLVHGEQTLMTRFLLQAGTTLPMHSHPHEQTGYLIKGRLTLTIDGVDHDIEPGDSWTIASGVEHGAVVRETALAIEVFSPVREDYLPYAPTARR